MIKIILNLVFLFVLSFEIQADFFKWEILVSEKGFNTNLRIIPVGNEGQIFFFEKEIKCRMGSFWTRIESDLLIEGKTLVCDNGENERKVQLVCRDNNKNRKYNKFKKLYPVSKNGFLLFPKLGSESPYLELRCFF